MLSFLCEAFELKANIPLGTRKEVITCKVVIIICKN